MHCCVIHANANANVSSEHKTFVTVDSFLENTNAHDV